MKYLLVSLVACFVTHNLPAQNYIPFPDSNAVWKVRYQSSIPSWECPIFYLSGDTTINNLLYSKLYWSLLDSNYFSLAGGIREDSQKVYYYKFPTPYSLVNLVELSTGEHLLYDFNVAVGDTVAIDTALTPPQGFPYMPIIILGIDSIQVNNDFRKRYRVGGGGYSRSNPFWIQGIGSLAGPLAPYISEFEDFNELYSFEQNSNVIWRDTAIEKACLSVSIQEPEERFAIEVYPNPFKNLALISIQASNHSYEEVVFQLSDITGRLVFTQRHTLNSYGYGEFQMQKEELTGGVYLYNVVRGDRVIGRGKVIIQ